MNRFEYSCDGQRAAPNKTSWYRPWTLVRCHSPDRPAAIVHLSYTSLCAQYSLVLRGCSTPHFAKWLGPFHVEHRTVGSRIIGPAIHSIEDPPVLSSSFVLVTTMLSPSEKPSPDSGASSSPAAHLTPYCARCSIQSASKNDAPGGISAERHTAT